LWRSLLHAAGGQGSGLRASWAVVHRQQRRVLARLQRVQPGRGDRALWRKFRVQAHYLRHQGFVRPGRLDAAVVGLARAGVPVHWVHGVFDAVCPLANSRHWAHMGRRQGGPVGWWPAHGGHLASEPGVLQALREAVAWG
jgi:proline iminopeptidase